MNPRVAHGEAFFASVGIRIARQYGVQMAAARWHGTAPLLGSADVATGFSACAEKTDARYSQDHSLTRRFFGVPRVLPRNFL